MVTHSLSKGYNGSNCEKSNPKWLFLELATQPRATSPTRPLPSPFAPSSSFPSGGSRVRHQASSNYSSPDPPFPVHPIYPAVNLRPEKWRGRKELTPRPKKTGNCNRKSASAPQFFSLSTASSKPNYRLCPLLPPVRVWDFWTDGGASISHGQGSP